MSGYQRTHRSAPSPYGSPRDPCNCCFLAAAALLVLSENTCSLALRPLPA